jgi:hypothetical protein
MKDGYFAGTRERLSQLLLIRLVEAPHPIAVLGPAKQVPFIQSTQVFMG